MSIWISVGANRIREDIFIPYTENVSWDDFRDWADENAEKIAAQYADLWGTDVTFDICYENDQAEFCFSCPDVEFWFASDADLCGDGDVDWGFDKFEEEG